MIVAMNSGMCDGCEALVKQWTEKLGHRRAALKRGSENTIRARDSSKYRGSMRNHLQDNCIRK